MLRMQSLLLFASLPLLMEASLGAEPVDRERTTKSDSASMLADALKKAKDQPAAEKIETLRAAARMVLQHNPKNIVMAEQLQATDDLEALEAALRTTYQMLTFKLQKEADLPEGFPDPTPVGEIQLKQYPPYRLARTTTSSDAGFFKLFAHIKFNRIEMTAPVEMTYRSKGKKDAEPVDMAFLYGNTKLGTTGDKFGGVTVQDVPAATTVTIGLQGVNSLTKIGSIERRLEEWLAQHASDYERAGSLRVMGYNSPQVPPESQYYEVELPVKRK